MPIPNLLSSASTPERVEAFCKALDKAAKAEQNKDAKKKLEKSAAALRATATALAQSIAKGLKGVTEDGLKRLNKSKPRTAEEAETMLLELEKGFPKGEDWAKSGRGAGKELADAAKSIREEVDVYKADRDLMSAAAPLLKELPTLAKECRNFIEDTADDLVARLGELRKELERLKSIEAEQEEEEDPANSSERSKRCAKTRSALKELRTGPPDLQFHCYVIDAPDEMFVYVARDASGGTEKAIRDLVKDGEKAKCYKAEVIYRDKSYHFVGAQLGSATFAPRIQKALVRDIGQRLRLACTNDKGKLEPPLSGDDFKDPIDYVISERPALRDRAKRLKSRREDLLRKVSASGALRRDGAYSSIMNRALSKFDSFLGEDGVDLDKADKALDLLETEILQPIERSRKDAKNDKAAFEAEFKRVAQPAKDIRQRGLSALLSQVRGVYREFRDEAPDRLPAAEAKLRELDSAMDGFDDLAKAADKAMAENNYVDEWVHAKKVLLTVAKLCAEWDDLRDAAVKEAEKRVGELKAGKEKAEKERKGEKSKT